MSGRLGSESACTMTEAVSALRAGQITSLDLVLACLARIEALEPQIRAWVEPWSENAKVHAKLEASRRDLALARGDEVGLLHGIPIGVKDLFDVEGSWTRCGVEHWAREPAQRDSELVARLRAAGAIILGKTVTTAFASFDPPPTRNPWNLDLTPGGSSSGSAAAVACGMCLGAVGSQTGGSITRPAAFCGVAGFKAAYGSLPLEGALPLASSLDHSGFLAKTVRDLQLLWLATCDPGERNGLDPSSPSILDFVREVTDEAVTLGRIRGPFEERSDPATRGNLEQFVQVMISAGHVVIDVEAPEPFDEVHSAHMTIMEVESGTFHEQHLLQHPEDYPPKIRGLVERGLATPAAIYQSALDTLFRARAEFTRRIESAGVQAYLTPAALGPAPDRSTTGDPAFNSYWSFLGTPTVSIPCGQSSGGLPMAVQLAVSQRSTLALFELANACEHVIEQAGLGVGPLPSWQGLDRRTVQENGA